MEGESMRQITDEESDGLTKRVISINRVMRVRKGGRTPSFNALSVVGDGAGTVGIGFGKANEVPLAIAKSEEDANKTLTKIPMVGGTIPHEVIGEACATKVLIKPAAPGKGLIAGGTVKAILEVAGIRDILSKCFGARNHTNIARATMNGLKQLKSAEDVARLRGKKIEEILAW